MTEVANGVSITNNGAGSPTRITVTHTGTYRFAYSAQIDKTSGNNDEVIIWARLNGVDVPRSAATLELVGQAAEMLPYVAYIFECNAGDYVEFYFQSPDNTVRIVNRDAHSGYTGPSAPAVIIDVEQIAYNGPTGSTGTVGATGPTGPAASDANAWSTYAVAWTASTTNPSIGDGTLTGRYKQIGKTTFVYVKMQAGSSTTFGSGSWRFSLPVNTNASTYAILPMTMLDNGSSWYQGLAYTEYEGDASYVTPVWNRGATGSIPVNATTPYTWVATDSLTFSGSYESV
jgi:hypothetical protein